GEESYSYSQAGVLTKLHPDTTTRWADDVDTYGGTMPRQVGRTKFTYDKAGRVTQTVTKRLSKKPLVKHFYYESGTQPVGYEDSDHPGVGWRYLYDGACRRVGKEQINTTTGEVTSRVMFLHEGDVLFGEYHTVNTMNPHMVGSAVLWPTDPGTGEILGQITINTNTTGSTAHQGGGTGYYPGGYSGDTGGSNNADDPYNQHNSRNNGGYSDGPYNHNDSTTGDGAGGVLGWPQQRVDAVFYSMVCDLAGAPKELIDPATGEIVGYATYTLFGKRHWAGTVNTPLLFTGQYEDTESGWVYNRFRYYDPHAGVYNAQDPLGLLANLGTAQGYVTNPVTWVDFLGLKKCKKTPKRNVPYNNGLPLQPTTKKPFLAGAYEDLSAVGPNATTDSYTAYERHHIISNKALERLGFSKNQRNRALAIQMTVADHQKTASWGSRQFSKLYRDFEVHALSYSKHIEGIEIAPELSSIEEMIVKAELGRIVQISGMKYYDVCIDAFNLYKQHGIILP
ncbi:RHS repeat-associated core domain-containing protein, partial [Corynebacterium matruchotii]|uniref:RHS repeat-associated core domain-containing protein n=1 Tax=Corynebacterium matruchotii TaxID=43768 RepID=UPI0028ED9EA2